MSDEPRASSSDEQLARLNMPGSAIGPGGMLRSVTEAGLTARLGRLPTKEEVDAELDKLFEAARTRVALDRLDNLPSE